MKNAQIYNSESESEEDDFTLSPNEYSQLLKDQICADESTEIPSENPTTLEIDMNNQETEEIEQEQEATNLNESISSEPVMGEMPSEDTSTCTRRYPIRQRQPRPVFMYNQIGQAPGYYVQQVQGRLQPHVPWFNPPFVPNQNFQANMPYLPYNVAPKMQAY